MYLRSCMVLLCLGHFNNVPTMMLINAADNSESTGFVGESSKSGSNYPDDEELHVGTSTSDEVGYFNPVEPVWQFDTCRQFNLELYRYFQFNQVVKVLNTPSRWVEVTADVNCLYRALSLWMTGTEEYHPTLRQLILHKVKNDKRIKFMLGQKNYDAHLEWTEKHFWATEVEIAAATLLLNTSIYLYSHRKGSWGLFNQNQTSKDSPTQADKCIYLQHTTGIHYNLVTDVLSDQGSAMQNALPIERRQPEFFYPVDEEWQYDKCLKWLLSLAKPFRFIQYPVYLNAPTKIVEMARDRNSFFRALSYCLAGTEIHHRMIRNRVAKEIFTNIAIKKLYKENEFISCSVENNWATKIEIIASAVVLNTSIFVYSPHTQKWDLYNKNVIDNAPVDTSIEKCIYLRQLNPNLYDVVQDVVGSFKP
ncbi:uncharacterized protein LOC126840762 [Adelges cooleyi]|uniref:uncharacterized protein LOC126840762 n=1 Tax=Adelges cooleyi TaxID=133065 RepID=UPI00217F2B71|nr:uncharacterized protein LOC126840762 [Adelges cooleyi]